MANEFHYSPDVFNPLVDTIPLLCRSKKDVVLFFRSAGVDKTDLAEVETVLPTDASSIGKFELVRRVLAKVNARGDGGLRPRREIIRRVVQYEDFSCCCPN